mmetsp:Transcript_18783/g.29612  ORF Transcript_18783/g.29612 Transcript_18783/m.29612 type:complete len:96 (+) Transcript_18783:659-946(+)
MQWMRSGALWIEKMLGRYPRQLYLRSGRICWQPWKTLSSTSSLSGLCTFRLLRLRVWVDFRRVLPEARTNFSRHLDNMSVSNIGAELRHHSHKQL